MVETVQGEVEANMNVMQHNVGEADRYIRITAGAALLAGGAGCLAKDHQFSGVLLSLLGGMMLAEGILGACPWYTVTGVNTNHDTMYGAPPMDDGFENPLGPLETQDPEPGPQGV